MPEMDGLEVQGRLSKRGVRLPIIFVTAHGDVPTCVRALQAGAFGFLEKPVDDHVLLDQIHAALARRGGGEAVVSAADFGNRVSQLTSREKVVLNMLIAGKTLKEIAAVNHVTVQTAWRHRVNIFTKLAVDNDVELVRIATQVGYDPD
jgi:FixJ family two-component response regulator